MVSCSSWSVVLLARRGKSFFRGQSFFLVVVVSLLRDQSFFVVSRFDRRGQSSWSVVLHGQSVVLVILVSRGGQSFFVDGVYILWWLCTRIY